MEFTDYEGKLIRVVTNLYHVSVEMVANIYKSRWGMELFFHWTISIFISLGTEIVFPKQVRMQLLCE
ncbi:MULTISPECIES: transposase [Pelosinus]|uniref:transposase n=1 Tax=Pelosinus TaxID=365348 RepID=UPI001113EE73